MTMDVVMQAIKRRLGVMIFSLGKIIASTGQTLFTVKHAVSYAFKHQPSVFFMDTVSFLAAACTLFVVCVTRVPAIDRQLSSPTAADTSSLSLTTHSYWQRAMYYAVVVSNVIAGFFSSVGAYLGTLVVIELITRVGGYHVSQWVSQTTAILVAISAFVSYYSFNIYKAKLNAIKLTHRLYLQHKNLVKTLLISFLNVASVPFIAYFLTKSSFYKMPYINTWLSISAIKWIAALSAITAFIASMTTTVPAMLEYFNESEDKMESFSWFIFRWVTYTTGLVDSMAFGLGNFIGLITITTDVFHLALYNPYIILLAIGCAISATCLNLTFSVRQGFNDLAARFSTASQTVEWGPTPADGR